MAKEKLLLASMGFVFVIFSSPAMAEFDNSIGFGVQYAGLFGWQGSWTEDNVHARIALGLVGATAGIDVNLDQHASIGATFGAVALAEVAAMNFNFYPESYTRGWRIGFELGSYKTNTFGEKSDSFTSLSFGYSFR